MEYPDIPSIPEEQEEEDIESPTRSPVIFCEFDPGNDAQGLHSRERRDGSPDQTGLQGLGGLGQPLPWQGLLRKTRSAV